MTKEPDTTITAATMGAANHFFMRKLQSGITCVMGKSDNQTQMQQGTGHHQAAPSPVLKMSMAHHAKSPGTSALFLISSSMNDHHLSCLTKTGRINKQKLDTRRSIWNSVPGQRQDQSRHN
jgi:hypothetical protein